MQSLLLEVGTEEIPAGYIQPALDAMALGLCQNLDNARISHSRPMVFGTPRRLAMILDTVAEKQKAVTIELMGPPKKIAYDEDGNPKIPAIKFAEKAGVGVEEISFKETKKGVYLCAKTSDPGVGAIEILAKILPDLINAVPFPKSMRWADLPQSFARPIHTIAALFGDKIIPFTWNKIKSGNISHGHFFMAPEKIIISSADIYLKKLSDAKVVADISKRRQMVKKGVDLIAKSLGGQAIKDEQLLDIVTNLVEFPAPAGGRFETDFLQVPEEVLITAMREHQKYFAIRDFSGKLMPCFVAVNNTECKDPQLVATGHERVLRARLSDAQFFYDTDKLQSMEDWTNRLSGILFQKKLGSLREKVDRVEKMAEFLAQSPEIAGPVEKAKKAAHLCKADLVSQVVVEFPKLQGVMGRVYAKLAGEDENVCKAIEEHYLPAYSGGPLPETKEGSIVAVADKMDSLCGCFAAGLIPTGNRDPYALRRQAIGVIRIFLKNSYSISLGKVVKKGLELVGEKAAKSSAETFDKIMPFLADRMAHMLAEQGFSKDVVQAVIAISSDDAPYLWQRVKAVEKLKKLPDYEALAIGFKRVVNIINQAKEKGELLQKQVDENLFEKPCENALHKAFKAAREKVDILLKDAAVDQALLEIAGLRPFVDDFFEYVMVMAEDKKIRENRLALLGEISGLFGCFADFSKIST